jgi:hypothetical protein
MTSPDDDPRFGDRQLRLVNALGAIALLLFVGMAVFFWTHPNYVPPCNSARYRCPHG